MTLVPGMMMMMDRFCTDVDVLAVAVARPSKASVSLQDNTNLFLELLLLLSIEHRAAVTLLVVLQSNSTMQCSQDRQWLWKVQAGPTVGRQIQPTVGLRIQLNVGKYK